MNFAFLNILKGFGGLEIQMIKRAKDALNLNHNAVVVALPNSKIEAECKNQNIPVNIINRTFKYIDFSATYNFGKLLERNSVDVCIVGKTELLSIAILARNLFSKSTAIILYQQMQSGVNKKDFFHNFIYRNLDGAVVLTKKMKDKLSSTTIFNKDKISVIPYGVDIDKFNLVASKSNLRKQFGLEENKFIIGCVARIEPHKGQLSLLDAVVKSGLNNINVVFAGNIDDNSYYNQLINFIQLNGLSNIVKFVPFTGEIEKLMNCFDIFVLPSGSETFGLVIIEAMASRVPVIATNSGGVPEIINDGTNGLLYSPKDISALSDCIKSLYNNGDLSNRLSENAYIKVVKEYDYNVQSGNFFSYCEKIYSNRLEKKS